MRRISGATNEEFAKNMAKEEEREQQAIQKLQEKIDNFDSPQTKFMNSNEKYGDQWAQVLAKGLKENEFLSTLEVLRISNQAISEEGAKVLADAVQGYESLKEIHLENNNIGPQGAEAFAEVLQNNTSLTELNLTNNNITDGGAESLVTALDRNPRTSLKILRLGKNNIEGQGLAVCLAECSNVMLEKLYLGDNKITPEAGEEFAEVLTLQPSLKVLFLNGNKIGDKGVVALAEALKNHNSLEMLDLYRNEIGDEGAEALAEAIKVNKSLKYLSIDGNNIQDEGIAKIVEALDGNDSLKHIECQRNPMSYSSEYAVENALKRNKAIAEQKKSADSEPVFKTPSATVASATVAPSGKEFTR